MSTARPHRNQTRGHKLFHAQQLSMKSIQLNVKMPTIVHILTFISRAKTHQLNVLSRKNARYFSVFNYLCAVEILFSVEIKHEISLYKLWPG